jgi:threonylcarbamoyladenosine tRNA methylthiotransferase CDKAL1
MQVFVRSFGCSANTADSEAISGCLVDSGFKLAVSEVEADVVIYNSCAVKGPTENRIISALKHIPSHKKVVVAGCLPLISFERLKREVRFDAIVGPSVGKDIVQIVRRILNGETIVNLEGTSTSKPELDLPRVRANSLISIVPVNFGCLGSCAFCCVVHARGHLRSCSIEKIVERIKHDVAAGVQEFWITSQDTASYGRDIGTNLAQMLKAVTAVEGNFLLRIGMMTPNLTFPFLDDLIEAFKSKKVFKFVHLPVQSGDDEVLQRMRRFYTTAEFEETISIFRKSFPEITLSTDVICGFPGETAIAFENTLQLIRSAKPDVVNVSKFFARPKTAALLMREETVAKTEINRRSSEVAALAKQIALEKNQQWVGWTGEIFVDEKGKIAGTWVGRNFAYKPVSVFDSKNLLGRTVHARVSRAFSTHLSGTIIA